MKIKFPKGGKFGEFGGKYIPETLVPAVQELEESYLKFKNDKAFKKELDYYLREYAGRPTPLYFADNLTQAIGGAKIYLKREDLLHGGAHKINNTLGQALLAKKNEKEKNHCRNRSRSTWCSYCDGMRLSWIKIRSLHGLQRYTKTKAKRV